MRTLTDYVGAVVDALGDVEPGDEQGARDALRGLDAGDPEVVEAAGAELDRFARDECGFDLRTGASTTTPPAPTTTGPPGDTAP
ncbi:MAG: hypothetical protein U5R31_04595 [Acidimicrobiia bacterium]|nr:hypothetical protein [Acidimicrobiia bacterium]